MSLWTGDTGPAYYESASVIGDWIDSEGRGDAAQRSGVLLAEILFGAMDKRPLTLVLLVPRFRLRWRGEDLAFLQYLAHGARPQDRIILRHGLLPVYRRVRGRPRNLERGRAVYAPAADCPWAGSACARSHRPGNSTGALCRRASPLRRMAAGAT